MHVTHSKIYHRYSQWCVFR